MDLFICGAFALDFVIRFSRAKSKLDFMRLGWIDLIESIPNLDMLRWGRSVRVLRILRLLRGIRSLHRLLSMLFRQKTKGGIISVVLTMFLLVVFASIAILFCEIDPESNIKTAGDAVWWSVTTITTVGYGDRYPVTVEGRMLAMTLMLAGVGLFGALSGIIPSVFLGQKEDDNSELLDEVRELRAELKARLKAIPPVLVE